MLELESDPYSLFVFAINSEMTKRKYSMILRMFFDSIEIQGRTIQERCKNFVNMAAADNKWLLFSILSFLQRQKERVQKKEISGATLRNYVKAVKLFCEMNDIIITWKKITRGLPKARRYADDRAPTVDEIRRMMDYPDRRIRTIICIMTSSGIRLGAWDYLRWKDIQPITKDGHVIAAKIIAYSGDEEEYFSFITPEAYLELEKWIEYRKASGEIIDGSTWLMRNLWNTKQGFKRGFIDAAKKLKSTGVKRLLEDALWIQGVRKNLEHGKKRHEFQAAHGFRKWFKTRCEISGMKPINIEKLMGHSTGISDSYYRATESELLDDYLEAVEHLTISNENRLQKQMIEIAEKVKDTGAIKYELDAKNREIGILRSSDRVNKDAKYALQKLKEESK